MNDIDSIDKKILYALGSDSRTSYKKIAQKINSKKETVAYRIPQLIEKGTITKFVPVFSLSRLGFVAFKIYFRFHGMDRDYENELVKNLVKNPRINWVARCVGNWDVMISVYAKDIQDFAHEKNAILSEYGKYIQEYAVTILEDAIVFNRDYLIKRSLEYRKEFVFGGRLKTEDIDEDQRHIMRLIMNDGRYRVTELARKLDLNAKTIISKIRDLESCGILQGYTVFLDLKKIDRQLFKICIYFQEYTDANYAKLVNFAREEKTVIHIIKSIGAWELEIELEAESIGAANEFAYGLRSTFPHIIKKLDVITIMEEPKLDFFPGWY
jgi:DNA-binding Lrp family transcriptional regulator